MRQPRARFKRQNSPDRLPSQVRPKINLQNVAYFPRATWDVLQTVDREQWKQEVMGHEELFLLLHDHLPPEMIYERELLICRL